MKICRQYQMNMFLEPEQNEVRIPPTDRDQMKELLGKLMITVLEEEKKKRKESKTEKRSPEVRKEEHRENLSLKEAEHE